MDPIAQIQRLGWEWLPNGLTDNEGAAMGTGAGVVITVQISGRKMRAFVPLSRVWVTFDQELQGVGCVGSAWVGEPFSCVGFFGFVKKAASSLGKVASAVVPKAITRAASSVISTAKNYAGAAYNAATRVPGLGTIVKAGGTLATLPARAAQQLIAGKRIDQIAADQFKTALGSARALAPYVQTVVSMVPGIGSGVSAGIGGALALAQGKPIDQALIEATRAAIPGGPLAQSAFSVATDVMAGRPIDQVALNAIPMDPTAKAALMRGLGAARELANGRPVDQVVIDNAVRSLPPAVQKAVQVGVAMGHARNLQGAAGAAVQGASQLAGDYARGVTAAQDFARGVRSPAVVAAMQRAAASRGALTSIVQHAAHGNPQAGRIVNALSMMRRPGGMFGGLVQRLAPAAMPRPPMLPAFGRFPRFA